jgi:hypothetical protein
MDGIENYTELLEEGPLPLGALRSMAIVDAAAELFPGQTFRLDPKDIHRGLKFVSAYTPVLRFKLYEQLTGTNDATEDLTKLTDEELASRVLAVSGPEIFAEIGVLTPEQKQQVLKLATTYTKYQAHPFKDKFILARSLVIFNISFSGPLSWGPICSPSISPCALSMTRYMWAKQCRTCPDGFTLTPIASTWMITFTALCESTDIRISHGTCWKRSKPKKKQMRRRNYGSSCFNREMGNMDTTPPLVGMASLA